MPRPERAEAGYVRSPAAAARLSRHSPLGRTGPREVRDVVLRGMDDPVLLVEIDHRRLNVRVAQHGLDLSDGGAMVQGEGGRRLAGLAQPSIKGSANASSKNNRCSGRPRGLTCCYRHGPKSWMATSMPHSVIGIRSSNRQPRDPRVCDALP